MTSDRSLPNRLFAGTMEAGGIEPPKCSLPKIAAIVAAIAIVLPAGSSAGSGCSWQSCKPPPCGGHHPTICAVRQLI